MAELDKASGFSDEELEDLFSAFGEVSAPESLKAGTLGLIASLPTVGVMQEAVQAPGQVQPVQATPAVQPAEPASMQSSVASTVRASSGGKRLRSRWKSIRVAAVAACLTLVVTGGAAYATPVSVVTLTRGDTSIELGVNLFEMSVSATSDDEAGRAIIESNNLVHVSYQDALTRAVNALEAAPGDGELELFVESAVGMQREQLENRNQILLADHIGNDSAPHDSEGPAARPVGERRSAVQPAADQPANAAPQVNASDDVQTIAGVQVGGNLASYEQFTADEGRPASNAGGGSGKLGNSGDNSGSSDFGDTDADQRDPIAPTPVTPIITIPDPELQWEHVSDGEGGDEGEDAGSDDPDEDLFPIEDDSVLYDFSAIEDDDYAPPLPANPHSSLSASCAQSDTLDEADEADEVDEAVPDQGTDFGFPIPSTC